jgi:Mn-dependent DtxR family transcriptional regulator
MDWDAMDRLHDKGYIGNPKTKAKSVTLTEKGERLSEELFKKHFGFT